MVIDRAAAITILGERDAGPREPVFAERTALHRALLGAIEASGGEEGDAFQRLATAVEAYRRDIALLGIDNPRAGPPAQPGLDPPPPRSPRGRQRHADALRGSRHGVRLAGGRRGQPREDPRPSPGVADDRQRSHRVRAVPRALGHRDDRSPTDVSEARSPSASPRPARSVASRGSRGGSAGCGGGGRSRASSGSGTRTRRWPPRGRVGKRCSSRSASWSGSRPWHAPR